MENRRDYELGQARREQIVRVIDLHEREKRQFSRDELIGRDGRSRILPETNALTAVELRDVFTGIELRVQGLIGYLPLTEQLALNLRPRFPVRNLWRMLEESDERYERYLPYFREYGDIGHDPPHLLLVRMFCFFLKEIMTTSLACLYVPEDFEGYFRPKMQFSRTANRFISRGDIINVAGTEFLHSRKLRVNGILKSACVDFLRIIPHLPSWKTERNQVQDALNLLTQVPVTAARPDDMALSMCVPALLRKGYIGALQVYFLYKGYSTMGFAYEAGGCRCRLSYSSLMTSLSNLFVTL